MGLEKGLYDPSALAAMKMTMQHMAAWGDRVQKRAT